MSLLRLRVYISHASEDLVQARNLYSRLKRDGFDAWLFEEQVQRPEPMEETILRELNRADYILLLRSHYSPGKKWLGWETEQALKSSAPKQVIKLEPMDLEDTLSSLRSVPWIDYYRENSYDELRKTLKAQERRKLMRRAAATGIPLVLAVAVFYGVKAYNHTPKPLPSGQPSVSRYERRGSSGRVIVFVHGIFGDAATTWKCDRTGAYWPRLITEDEAFQTSDVYVAAFDSPFWGNTMTIDEIVSNLANRFESDAVFAHREVVFVVHSLGGLIVQRFLLTHRKLATQVPFIFFFSTPETGAQIAQLASMFSADPLLKGMFPGDQNGYLLNLENEWIEAGFGIKRFCAYEKKAMNGILVVDRLSGTRNCTNRSPIPINEDHAGIVKPCSRDADAYIALRNAVVSNPISTATTTTPANQTTSGPQSPNVNGAGSVAIEYGTKPEKKP